MSPAGRVSPARWVYSGKQSLCRAEQSGNAEDVSLTTSDSAAEFVPADRSLAALREAAETCRGCNLYLRATQTVFGAGRAGAPLMLVGEQHGDVVSRNPGARPHLRYRRRSVTFSNGASVIDPAPRDEAARNALIADLRVAARSLRGFSGGKPA